MVLKRPDSRWESESHAAGCGSCRGCSQFPFQKAPFPSTTAVALGSGALWSEPEAAKPRLPPEAWLQAGWPCPPE